MMIDHTDDINHERNTTMARRNAATPVADEVTPTTDEAPAEETFSAKDLANELGIDAKAFRRWLRAHTTDRANKGGRWIFTAESKAQFIDAYRTKAKAGTEAKLPDADDDES